MAITKVGTYRNPPEDITDYEAIVAHLEAYTRQIGNQGMILTEWTNTTNAPKIAMGSYISHGGVLYVVDTEDYALPALSSDGTYYIRVAVSGETLALSYTTNIADYSWNAVYGGLYHPDESQVLPYQVVKSGALVEKWKITNLMQGSGFSRVRYDGVVKCESLEVTGALGVTGAISGASLNTGDGDFKIGQNLRITDNVTFSRLGIITTIRQIGFNGSTTGVIGNINIGELVNVTFQGWSHSVSQRVCILPSGSLFCVALAGGMDGAVLSTGVKAGGSAIATVEAGLPDVYGVLRVWRIA